MSGVGECPKCGSEVRVHEEVETHSVNVGIGSVTAAEDRWIEIDEQNCGCELSEDDVEYIAKNACSPY